MIGEPAKNVHGVGIGTLSKILAVKSLPVLFLKKKNSERSHEFAGSLSSSSLT